MLLQNFALIKKGVNCGKNKNSVENIYTKRDVLKVRVDEIEKQKNKNCKAFKEGFEHDSKQFTSSVKDFFENNK